MVQNYRVLQTTSNLKFFLSFCLNSKNIAGNNFDKYFMKKWALFANLRFCFFCVYAIYRKCNLRCDDVSSHRKRDHPLKYLLVRATHFYENEEIKKVPFFREV